jgi:hypothetical protein
MCGFTSNPGGGGGGPVRATYSAAAVGVAFAEKLSVFTNYRRWRPKQRRWRSMAVQMATVAALKRRRPQV